MSTYQQTLTELNQTPDEWINAVIHARPAFIYQTNLDICFIANAVQGDTPAAVAGDEIADRVYNAAVGCRTTLTQLFESVRSGLAQQFAHLSN